KQTTDFYDQLEKTSARLVEGLTEVAREAGVATVTNRVGSMFTTFFTDQPVFDWTTATRSNRETFGRFFQAMLAEGVYLAPSQFEAAFVSAAHSDEIIERTVMAARQALKQ